MSKRFVLAPGRLQVSLPGYDVDTCGLSDLAFDLRFASMAVYRRGMVQTANNAIGAYYFGETLSAPPLVLFNCVTSLGYGGGPTYYYWQDNSLTYVWADAYADRIEFRVTGGATNTFRFIAFKSNP